MSTPLLPDALWNLIQPLPASRLGGGLKVEVSFACNALTHLSLAL